MCFNNRVSFPVKFNSLETVVFSQRFDHESKTVTLAVEVLQESLQLGRLGVVFPLFGGPFPGGHVCVDTRGKTSVSRLTV